MPRPLIPALAAALVAAAPASAETRVQVPDQYDGSWSITAVTTDGPCAASKSYQVRIAKSEASIPGDAVDIDGGVSAGGAVQATITQGSNKVPITGTLDAAGSGTGTWRSSGLISCSGSWSAKRAG